MDKPDVVIVGGGLAGLCCARRLHSAGMTFLVLEAADDIGGRVRTDRVDGFLLDRGFQVLLTAYPEAREVLDYSQLQLARFEPGALVRFQGKFRRFVDPWRRPRHVLSTALSPVASLADKWKVVGLRRRVCRGSLEDLYARPESATIDRLRLDGFSEQIVERFFRPFLGGVFLDHDLQTSSRMFEFVFRMFAQGDATLPAQGMAQIPRQIAHDLPEDAMRCDTEVASVTDCSVSLMDKTRIDTRAVVVACEAPAAARLLGDDSLDDLQTGPGQGVTCIYFAADRPPVDEPILVLNGDGEGPINNLCVPTLVSPVYGPAHRALVSVTVLGITDDEAGLRDEVRNQLRDWFGQVVQQWSHLRTYRIPYALPNQVPPALSPVAKSVRSQSGVLVCGDHRDTGSIQGAMVSGRRVAEQIIRDLA